jgi:translation initiation factor 2 beta subunit (eIF-2beta)/eIF-5
METKYDIDDLLDRAYEELENIMHKKKASITLPDIKVEKRKVYIVNIDNVARSMNRDVADIMQFVNSELNVTTSICKMGLKINGSFKAQQIQNVLVEYTKKFVLCKSCRSKNTAFETINRQKYLVCKNCRCEVCI